jgi:hypothetical protein
MASFIFAKSCQGAKNLIAHISSSLAKKVEGKALLFSKSRQGAGSKAFSHVPSGHPLTKKGDGENVKK